MNGSDQNTNVFFSQYFHTVKSQQCLALVVLWSYRFILIPLTKMKSYQILLMCPSMTFASPPRRVGINFD